MAYLIAKAAHIVGFVTWFAGLFYAVRLFIYDVEAAQRPESERHALQAQLRVMQRRLWFGITWPAMIMTLAFGVWLLVLYGRLNESWLILKLALIAALVAYHLTCGHVRRALSRGACRWSSAALRAWNEVATLLLVAIVFTAVLKDHIVSTWTLVALAGLAVLILAGMVAYRRARLPRRSGP